MNGLKRTWIQFPPLASCDGNDWAYCHINSYLTWHTGCASVCTDDNCFFVVAMDMLACSFRPSIVFINIPCEEEPQPQHRVMLFLTLLISQIILWYKFCLRSHWCFGSMLFFNYFTPNESATRGILWIWRKVCCNFFFFWYMIRFHFISS